MAAELTEQRSRRRRPVITLRPGCAAMGGGILGQLDAGDLEERLRLLQEEAVGAAHVEQPAARAVACG